MNVKVKFIGKVKLSSQGVSYEPGKSYTVTEKLQGTFEKLFIVLEKPEPKVEPKAEVKVEPKAEPKPKPKPRTRKPKAE